MAVAETILQYSPHGHIGVDYSKRSIYRPPLTPGADLTEASRKRPRTTLLIRSCNSGIQSWSAIEDFGDASPAPLANEHYQLAGGYDTPGLAAVEHVHFDDTYDAGLHLRSWQAGRDINRKDLFPSNLSGALARERNGKGRENRLADPQDQGWASHAINLVGDMASAMIDFCLSTVSFIGFRAGGGENYATPTIMSSYLYEPSPPSLTSGPDNLPKEIMADDSEQYGTSPFRPAKRLHTDTGYDWVMVEHEHDASPRLSARKTSATLSGTLSLRPSASSASSRRSLIPVSRRQSSIVLGTGSPAPVASPHDNHTRHASLAPTRSPTIHKAHHGRQSSTPRASFGSSTSRDSAQARLRIEQRKDHGAGKSMHKMSRQVQELIRQGREALGTRIEIDDQDNGASWESTGDKCKA